MLTCLVIHYPENTIHKVSPLFQVTMDAKEVNRSPFFGLIGLEQAASNCGFAGSVDVNCTAPSSTVVA